ncbi:MAG: HAMP domain-containing protein [Gammaproteobacteria bacterium]|nr:HAMP domain-containing protein [Gammaproteobacteria bacterium]
MSDLPASADASAPEPEAARGLQARLQRLAASRHRISVQLYAGIGVAVSFTLIASLVALWSFNRLSDAQDRVNRHSVPGMAAAFGVARQGAALVAAAPRLTAAANREEFGVVAGELDREEAVFQGRLSELMRQGEQHVGVRARADALIANVEALQGSVAQGFDLADRGAEVRAELNDLQARLTDVLVPIIDDQLFYAVTGYRTLGAPARPREARFVEEEFGLYRRLAGLRTESNVAAQLLTNIFNLPDRALLEAMRDRFQASAGSMERHLSALGNLDARERLAPMVARLTELGIGGGGGFELRTAELEGLERQERLLAENRALANDLALEVEGLVSEARESAGAATQASADAILTGQNLLLALNGISIVGAILIAWLFVGRVLLRRLDRLSERMRAMAGGDLEATVDISGRDEVADMAAALEVFRRHALEVQRLNLVERLAEELREKNDTLEQTLEELSRAQDQIVMREKLAALGELTAGVAHEIKNPLNFVKNFSEASEELLEELIETLEEAGDALTEDQRELVAELGDDLTENLKLIRGHGDRADRIVRDMLRMQRTDTHRQPTDINELIDDHVRLAFHSARANDSDFRLDIQQDFDSGMGTLDVASQDLGRVILNLVGNACYATHERRLAEEAEGRSFEPTLHIVSRRLEDRVEIRVRDNGTGMPKEVADKIFNPFFTTKPTDQGTGLGLSLSNDVVREHGGSIRVESEQGSFTEMIVELPTEAAAAAPVEEDMPGEASEG